MTQILSQILPRQYMKKKKFIFWELKSTLSSLEHRVILTDLLAKVSEYISNIRARVSQFFVPNSFCG